MTWGLVLQRTFYNHALKDLHPCSSQVIVAFPADFSSSEEKQTSLLADAEAKKWQVQNPQQAGFW